MRIKLIVILICYIVVAGCKTSTPTQPSGNSPQSSMETSSPSASPGTQASPPGLAESVSVPAKVDACALLTSKEIEAVQGEAVKETKLSGKAATGLSISQCFFTLPTFTNSVSLLVAQKGEGASAQDPKDFWRQTFHATKRGKEEAEKEKESAPPKKVKGIGDEAFWTGSRIGGALYVLKGDAYVRVSIGGPSDQATKLSRSRALAQKALARL
jgi:hypothetical protein